MLDTRERRRDLTDRECASIYGGVIAPLLRAFGRDDVRTTLQQMVVVIDAGLLDGTPTSISELLDKAFRELVDSPASSVIVAFMSSMFGCLSDNARAGAALAAFRWWASLPEDKWVMVEQSLPPAWLGAPS